MLGCLWHCGLDFVVSDLADWYDLVDWCGG